MIIETLIILALIGFWFWVCGKSMGIYIKDRKRAGLI